MKRESIEMNQDVRRMELGSVAHLATDVQLVLYDRTLHPELFRHYGDYRIQQPRYFADVWIIGLGHVVSVTAGARTITELIGPESDVLPTRGVQTRFRFKGERDLDRRVGDGWQYLLSSQAEIMEEPLYKSVHNDLIRYAAKRGRLVNYDQWAGDLDLAPFSYIDHEARDSEFHVHAYHAFPHERTIVKTQTIFELLV